MQKHAAQGFEIVENLLFLCVEVLKQGTHGAEIRDARDFFAEGAVTREACAHALHDRGVAGGEEHLLEAGLFFGEHFVHAGEKHVLVAAGFEQHFRKEAEHVGDLVLNGLAGQAQVEVAAAFKISQNKVAGGHAACLGGDGGTEFAVIPSRRAGVREGAGEKRQEGQEAIRNFRHGQKHGGVGDAAGGQLVAYPGHAAFGFHSARNDAVLRRKIAYVQVGNGGRSFGGVLGRLGGLQFAGDAADLVPFRGRGCGLDPVQTGALFLFLARGEARVRGENDEGTGFVFEEAGADCVLKNALSRGETFLDARERGFPGQARKRGGVVEPYGKSLEHGGEPAGEVAGIALAVVELHGVHSGFHGRGGDPLFGEIGEGIENEGFGSADILSRYALEAG